MGKKNRHNKKPSKEKKALKKKNLYSGQKNSKKPLYKIKNDKKKCIGRQEYILKFKNR